MLAFCLIATSNNIMLHITLFSPRPLNLAEQTVINGTNKSNHESEQCAGQDPTSQFLSQPSSLGSVL